MRPMDPKKKNASNEKKKIAVFPAQKNNFLLKLATKPLSKSCLIFLSFFVMFSYAQDVDFFKTKSKEGELSQYSNSPLMSSEKSSQGSTTGSVDAKRMKRIVIFDQGRVKPLDSFAKEKLLLINGKSTMTDVAGNKYDAINWLARVMFKPEDVLDDKIIKISFPEVLDALQMSPDKSRRHSFNEIARRMPMLERLVTFSEQIPEDDRSPLEKEFLRIYAVYVEYYTLLSAFLFVLPSETFYISSDKVLADLGLEELAKNRARNTFSYLEIMERGKDLLALAELAEQKKESGKLASDYILIELKNRYQQFAKTYQNLPPLIFPSFSHGSERWFSPWQLFAISEGYDNLIKDEILYIQNMIFAYRNNLQDNFDSSVEKYISEISFKLEKASLKDNAVRSASGDYDSLKKQYDGEYSSKEPTNQNIAIQDKASYKNGEKIIDDYTANNDVNSNMAIRGASILSKISAEVQYNALDPFYKAMLLYAYVIILAFAMYVLERYLKIKKLLWNLSLILFSCAVALSTYGLILRMYITSRPPITNLYTTFVFVSLTVAILCLFLEWFYKNKTSIISGAIASFVLLLISLRFAVEGDTMEVLIAVLRSNFWLSTHVITINLGYAGITFSGVIGHFYLIQHYFFIRNKKKWNTPTIKQKQKLEEVKEKQKKMYSMIYAVQAFGIIFTALGTLLGGIWADQSWGRFWGWDPKENGSLLILLWSAALFHARISGWIREVGYAAGAIVGIVVVMIAWFGINLLGVGLHSYGFTSGIAYPLFLYIVLQLAFVFFMMYLLYVQKTNMVTEQKGDQEVKKDRAIGRIKEAS